MQCLLFACILICLIPYSLSLVHHVCLIGRRIKELGYKFYVDNEKKEEKNEEKAKIPYSEIFTCINVNEFNSKYQI